jgi:hypothetical protein
MFTASTRTTRLTGIAFAVFMAIAVNGSMLMKFDSVATAASSLQNPQVRTETALETVTIVGRRI